MALILGSSSPFRAQILRDAGYEFMVIEPNVDERAMAKDIRDPQRLTMRLAHAKADAVLKLKPPSGLLITSDQVAVSDGEILHKPRTTSEATHRLQRYADFPPMTYTAVVVTETTTRRQVANLDRACVVFKRIPKRAIDAAIERGTIMQACGAFDIDDPDLAPYIRAINGDRTSVLGLPIPMLKALLAVFGQ